MSTLNHAGISISQIKHQLIVTLQGDLSEQLLNVFKTRVLEQIQQRKAKIVVIELSAIQVLDLHDYEELQKLIKMIALLGGETRFIGFQPGVIAYLSSVGADFSGIKVIAGLDDVD